MVFRKGGRLPAGDNLTLGDEPLKIVRKLKYLGITLCSVIQRACTGEISGGGQSHILYKESDIGEPRDSKKNSSTQQ